MKGKVFVFVAVLVVLIAVSEGLRRRRPKNLKITDCMKNASDAAVTLKSYHLNPDPMELPGNMTLGGLIQVHRFLDGNLTGHVQISKWLGFFWLPVPCISNVGTCTYTDLCGMIIQKLTENGTDVTNATSVAGNGTDVTDATTEAGKGTDVTTATTEAGNGHDHSKVTHASHTPHDLSKVTKGAGKGHDVTTPTTEAGKGADVTTPTTEAGKGADVTTATTEAGKGTDVTTATTEAGKDVFSGDVLPGQDDGEVVTCPQALQHSKLPACSCPFPPGDYVINQANLEVKHLSGLISWLATGDYKAKVWLTDEEDETVACLQLELSVVDGKKEPSSCSGFLCSIFG